MSWTCDVETGAGARSACSSGVDPITRRQFWELIYAEAHKGTTIFVTTHYMDEAEYCDRVSIMVDGVIEALETPKKLKEQF
jgi:ABC-2 type transport system ATP-binding protein